MFRVRSWAVLEVALVFAAIAARLPASKEFRRSGVPRFESTIGSQSTETTFPDGNVLPVVSESSQGGPVRLPFHPVAEIASMNLVLLPALLWV